MKYNEQANLDPSQMGGGGGNRGKIAIGGGAGLLIAVLALLFGVNPGDILGGTQEAAPRSSDGSTPSSGHCNHSRPTRTASWSSWMASHPKKRPKRSSRGWAFAPVILAPGDAVPG